jgi:hypothetical protein
MMVRASHVETIILLARNGLHRGTAQKAVMSVPGILAGLAGARPEAALSSERNLADGRC